MPARYKTPAPPPGPAPTTLNQSAGSIFQNLANATLTVQSGVTWNADNGTLDNQSQGTLTVEPARGTASFNGFFTNEGDLEISSGTLVLGAGGSVTGNVRRWTPAPPSSSAARSMFSTRGPA